MDTATKKSAETKASVPNGSRFTFYVSRITHHASRSTLCIVLALLVSTITAHSQPVTFTTLSGYPGGGSADGTGSGALFSEPQFVAVDSAGKVYVADSGNNTIRVIT